ncbi:hypothetical protein SMB34_16480 [Thalassospira permensis NBRC 106175]|uniref:Uncharacterized protein n=1 Tax=Thalassospira permensis NBRC 106175 TaxID=1353532 RepID=A0ABR4TPI0_9PROT|nr:hypothetical protein SMB34_16480 [Thalassospira permensis NBRC 106175]
MHLFPGNRETFVISSFAHKLSPAQKTDRLLSVIPNQEKDRTAVDILRKFKALSYAESQPNTRGGTVPVQRIDQTIARYRAKISRHIVLTMP